MKNTGGPAFPRQPVIGPNEDNPHRTSWWDEGQEGMMLRDYFAAKAMGELAGLGGLSPDETAVMAFDYADAMLKQRAKTT